MSDDVFWAPDHIDEKYAYGSCMYLAAALNRVIGWPIRVVMSDDTDRAFIAHAWVVNDASGMMFDVNGCYPESMNGWIGVDPVIIDLTESDLLALTRKTSGHSIPRQEWDADVAEALLVIQQHFGSQVEIARKIQASVNELKRDTSDFEDGCSPTS